MGAVKTLQSLRGPDMRFPHRVLVGNDSALVVFCAAFLGRQDAYWIAKAGLVATCVDEDRLKLLEMEQMYPESWSFVCQDAFTFAANARRQWDIITLDPFTHDFERVADSIETWCGLARRAVVVGTGVDTIIEEPYGWEITSVERRSDYEGGVFWTTLERP